MVKRKLSQGKPDQLDGEDQERLLSWYRQWHDRPWAYAVLASLKKLPIILVIVLVSRMEDLGNYFSDPGLLLRNRWWFFLLAFMVFIIYHRISWNNQAFRYYLLSVRDPLLPQPSAGSVLDKRVRKISTRLPSRYRTWLNRKYILMLIPALGLPLLFLLVSCLIVWLKADDLTWENLVNFFEPGGLVLVLIILWISGALLGQGIWKAITVNYQLLQKANPGM